MASLPNFEIKPAFACPIVTSKMPDHQQLTSRLREYFLAWENDSTKRNAQPTEVVKPGVYESDFYLFQNNPEPEVQILARFCLQSLGYMISQLNGYTAEQMSKIRIYQHSWYHITRNGGYTACHNHPMASWSGVFCVSTGDPLPDRPNNGVLRFLEPRISASMYTDLGNSRIREPYGHGDLVFPLAAGQLLLFPSYLMHEVAPFYGKNERITVAFNAWVRHQDQPIMEPGYIEL